jgi:tetratricopeptide (TPR) repeat protein
MTKYFITFALLTVIIGSYLILSDSDDHSDPASLDVLPEVPQMHDVGYSEFDRPVQDQFRKRYDYLDLVMNQHDATPKQKGWAVGELGKLFHAYQKNELAIDCYLIASQWDSENHEWYYLLGQVYQSQGELENSKDSYFKAYQLSNSEYATYWLAVVYFELGDTQSSKQYFNEVLIHNPLHAGALLGLSDIHIESDDPENAKKLLYKAFEEHPNSFQILYKLGQVYTQLGELEKAKLYLDRVSNDEMKRVSYQIFDPLMQEISDSRVSSQSWHRRGYKALSQGFHRKAITYFQKSIEADDSRIDSKFNLAIALFKLKQFNKSKAILDELIQLEPDTTEFFSLYGKIFELEKDFVRAESMYQNALESSPISFKEAIQLAEFYTRMNETDKAIKHFRSVLETDPSNVKANQRIKELLNE